MIARKLTTLLLLAALPALCLAQDAGDGKPDDDAPIPELPPDKLPKRTGELPDPAKEQFTRGAIYLRIAETVEPREGEPYSPESPVLRNHLAEYFRRAGWAVVDDIAKADYRIEGSFDALFREILHFKGRPIAIRFDGGARMTLADSSGTVIEEIEIPEESELTSIPKDALDIPGADSTKNIREEQYVVRDLRRKVAHMIWQRLHYGVATFTHDEIPGLIDSLTEDPLEADEPADANDVIAKLKALRLEAVPYLVEALIDERAVLADAKYPGMTDLNRDKLRVYHIADKALEEIFQKVSRLGLDTPKKHRFVVIRGWENEWRRFCPPFRDSPSAKPAKEDGKEAASGKAAPAAAEKVR